MKNVVITLQNWWAQPIHCPFCGTSLAPSDHDSCRHLLYIIGGGNFLYRSRRLNSAIGIQDSDDPEDGEFTSKQIAVFGRPSVVIQKIGNKFTNLVVFDISSFTDGNIIGFAPLDEELCLFGRVHISPYQ